MNLENKKPIIILKNDHLKDGIKPIINGIYDNNNLDKETRLFIQNFEKDAEYVNYSYRKHDIEKNSMYNSGDSTYVISLCNEKNKYSLNYFNCTGVVAVGISKITGKNVSFLSHQDPDFFINNKSETRLNFKKDIDKDFDYLISQCVPGSIDVVVFGGNKEDVYKNSPEDDNFRIGIDDMDELLKCQFDEYNKSIKYLNCIVKQKMGFSPIVISGPNDNFKTRDHSLKVYFDNENRRLYMLKPKQEESNNNESFEASNVE